uniref:Uncharacterized protein n=1 Tax=Melopsittacus undulatus TaxID=13146 RepID=A0A8C6JDD2_MELUD
MQTEVFIALVVCLLILQFLKLQWMRTQLPPGPVPLPIIGNLWLLDFRLRRETLTEVFITVVEKSYLDVCIPCLYLLIYCY